MPSSLNRGPSTESTIADINCQVAAANRIAELLAASRAAKEAANALSRSLCEPTAHELPVLPRDLSGAPQPAVGVLRDPPSPRYEAAMGRALTTHLLPISQSLNVMSAKVNKLESDSQKWQKQQAPRPHHTPTKTSSKPAPTETPASSAQTGPPRPSVSASSLNTGPFQATNSGLEQRLSGIETLLMQHLVPPQHLGPHSKTTETEPTLLDQAELLHRANANLSARTLNESLTAFQSNLLRGFSSTINAGVASLSAAVRRENYPMFHQGFLNPSQHFTPRPLDFAYSNFGQIPDPRPQSFGISYPDPINSGQAQSLSHNNPSLFPDNNYTPSGNGYFNSQSQNNHIQNRTGPGLNLNGPSRNQNSGNYRSGGRNMNQQRNGRKQNFQDGSRRY